MTVTISALAMATILMVATLVVLRFEARREAFHALRRAGIRGHFAD